ncbi:N(4)-acetylcytidine aminohydrolase [Photobacterium chitinilyticum]|uniref:N(4)-acetylcytidine amidohydrolase n=1 Tax=Photobacterium chitinilyticum TaxID=2485123 RepID=A0A3S3UJQ7_9GAMM|nr:N(4)-acetylcytidine aminohydrolase [Photobacterium chitinilyticum]RWX55560.1 ASCH domain-containing protein [Photobacterium chitinilyticum]
MAAPTVMTFFERFEADILAGKKTITIRDESENNYVPGTVVNVSTFEDGREFCRLEILSVEPILFDELSDFHAEQENMSLPVLKEVIQEIYPGIKQLFVVSYKLAL